MANEAAETADQSSLSHNLVGQRLGRKGRYTRERILAATARLLAAPDDTVISLSAVAREASLGMTTLYLYFSDITELLIAALEPIMELAQESYVAQLQERWPDEDLAIHCQEFVRAFHAFWQRHTRILHLRNSLADAYDKRMRLYRIETSTPIMQLLARQMDDEAVHSSPAMTMATVLFTSIERLITVTTDTDFPYIPLNDAATHIGNLLKSEARLLEIAIRDRRDSVQKANIGEKQRKGGKERRWAPGVPTAAAGRARTLSSS